MTIEKPGDLIVHYLLLALEARPGGITGEERTDLAALAAYLDAREEYIASTDEFMRRLQTTLDASEKRMGKLFRQLEAFVSERKRGKR